MQASMIDDLCGVENPKITVLTASLNHGRFLQQTIETIVCQSYRSFEHIVIDGGSTDDTIEILKRYPHIQWISEKDGGPLEAYQKGLALARGQYIIICSVSDGFHNGNWLCRCADVLDNDEDISLVWGFPQHMSEEGDLLNVCFQEFFNDPPPQKQEFLAMWLATGFPLADGNYCLRSKIMKKCLPNERSEQHFKVSPNLGLIYNFMTQGFCPYFLPVVANFGRRHGDQLSQRLRDVEGPAGAMYFQWVADYKRKMLRGEIVHSFRNGRAEVINEIRTQDLGRLRRQIWRHKLLRSRLLRCDLYTIAKGLRRRFRERLLD